MILMMIMLMMVMILMMINCVTLEHLQGATKDCNLPGAKNLTCASKTWLAAHSDQGLGRQVHHTPQAASP